MHGRKRSESKALQRDPKVAAKLEAKALAWHQLQAELLKRRRGAATAIRVAGSGDSTTEEDNNDDASSSAAVLATTLQLIEKAVTVNPDPLWLWNFRSELLLLESNNNNNNRTSWWETEQAVTQQALVANPKAYGAWHYRKRCLQQHLWRSTGDPNRNKTVLEEELALTAQFFRRDERNFHCWSYRRFVVSCCLWNVGVVHGGAPKKAPPLGEWRLDDDDDDDGEESTLWMGAQIGGSSLDHDAMDANDDNKSNQTEMVRDSVTEILDKEWAFTEEKIRDNFSNFSAFHYRSKLLPILVKRRQKEPRYCESVLSAELELVLNAVFTEPDDQTAWWYQRFLLDFMMKSSSSIGKNQSEYDRILQSHMDQLRELVLEEDSGNKWVLIGFLQCLQHSRETTTEERLDLIDRLIEIDRDRIERYLHLKRRIQNSIDTNSGY